MSKLVKRVSPLKGRPSNRRTKPEIREKIIAAIKEGYVHQSIADEYGVSLSTVARLSQAINKGLE